MSKKIDLREIKPEDTPPLQSVRIIQHIEEVKKKIKRLGEDKTWCTLRRPRGYHCVWYEKEQSKNGDPNNDSISYKACVFFQFDSIDSEEWNPTMISRSLKKKH